jgi:competence protein ComEC
MNKMLLGMISIATGISLVCFCPALPAPEVVFITLVLSFLLSMTLRLRLPGLLMLGAAWGCIYGYSIIESQLPTSFEGKELWVQGIVVNLPETYIERGKVVQRFELSISEPVCVAPSECHHGLKQVRLKWYDFHHQYAELIKPGQSWRLLVKLKRPYGMANPGGFDYQSWLVQQGVGATGYVRDASANQLLSVKRWTIDRLRWQVAVMMESNLSHLTHLNLLKALLIGDKRGVSRQQWDLFAGTGTTHLMVISGLHVGLVSALVFIVMRYMVQLCLPRASAEVWAGVITIASALIYALAAGFSLPTQRAFIMITVAMLAIISRRHIVASQALVTAFLICLIVDPLAPISLSFWLSFAAVGCIFYGSVGRRQASRNTTQLILSQYVVFIGLFPVLAILLGQVSFLSPLANTVLVPLFSLLIVPGNLLAALLSLLSESLAGLIWHGLDVLLSYSLFYLELLYRYGESAVIPLSTKPLMVKLLALTAVMIVLLPKGVPNKYFGFVLLLPLFFYRPPLLMEGALRLTVLDVGQGLAVVMKTRDHSLIYDMGPQLGRDFDAGSSAILPFMQHQGISHVDTVVVSHADSDHAGGWRSVVNRVPVSRLFYGEPVTPLIANSQFCLEGQHWTWNGVAFQFLHPRVSDSIEISNNRSCVLMVTAGEISFLLPGDIDQSTEMTLLERHKISLAATVLLAPHHGSASSSSWPFIKQVSPQIVVFSHGYRNQFGHPREDVVDRYQQLGSQIYSTSESGAISFEVNNGRLKKPIQYRKLDNRYWVTVINSFDLQ